MGIGIGAMVWGYQTYRFSFAFTKLLLDIIFKVNVGIQNSTIIISVIVLFLITAGTIGIKVWQAIKINPVKLLRME